MKSEINKLESKIVELKLKLDKIDMNCKEEFNVINKRIDKLIQNCNEINSDNVWNQLYDDDNNPYYINISTGKTVWDLPHDAKLRNKKTVPPLRFKNNDNFFLEKKDDLFNNNFFLEKKDDPILNSFDLNKKPKNNLETLGIHEPPSPIDI